MKIVLASQSPRRAVLLRQIGLDFHIHPSNIDEDLKGLPVVELVETLALHKAVDVAHQYPGHFIIGADTLVTLDNEILSKPLSSSEASSMLNQLSGKTHSVFTGVSLVVNDKTKAEMSINTFSVETKVTFSQLGQDEIDQYIATGSPMDKAGAYGIQDDWGSVFVERILGDYYNVVGLPLNRLYNEIRRFKPEVLDQIVIPS